MNSKLTLTRDITTDECPWIYDLAKILKLAPIKVVHKLREGKTLFKYEGLTGDAVLPNEIAVTFKEGQLPFFCIPKDAIEGETEEDKNTMIANIVEGVKQHTESLQDMKVSIAEGFEGLDDVEIPADIIAAKEEREQDRAVEQVNKLLNTPTQSEGKIVEPDYEAVKKAYPEQYEKAVEETKEEGVPEEIKDVAERMNSRWLRYFESARKGEPVTEEARVDIMTFLDNMIEADEISEGDVKVIHAIFVYFPALYIEKFGTLEQGAIIKKKKSTDTLTPEQEQKADNEVTMDVEKMEAIRIFNLLDAHRKGLNLSNTELTEIGNWLKQVLNKQELSVEEKRAVDLAKEHLPSFIKKEPELEKEVVASEEEKNFSQFKESVEPHKTYEIGKLEYEYELDKVGATQEDFIDDEVDKYEKTSNYPPAILGLIVMLAIAILAIAIIFLV